MSVKGILSWLGGIGLGVATIVGLILFTVRHYIKTLIDKNKDRLMQDYKYQLDKVMREAEHDFQRRIHDFGLYSTKRHESYREAFRLISVSYLAVTKANKIQDIDEYLEGKDDTALSLVTYLMKHDISDEDIKKFRDHHADIKDKRIIARSIVTTHFTDDAAKKLRSASNYIFQNELYFSSEVEFLLYECLKDISFLFKNTTDAPENFEIESKIDDLKRAMKGEMSVGYYEEEGPY
ncbi:hypothetical protein [Terribacillus saccharophilus]|uniref:hypothetical protein n=1 Tax=Terribacillus saccharophilus TaxID=361277 RepID=UPI002DD083B0|nr:hypothetical protein [Terribacillus saccharophilus]MEC0288793.1 hypothetical protein [Terribacillus saccharophilus]